jgi:hypothetical protein
MKTDFVPFAIPASGSTRKARRPKQLRKNPCELAANGAMLISSNASPWPVSGNPI